MSPIRTAGIAAGELGSMGFCRTLASAVDGSLSCDRTYTNVSHRTYARPSAMSALGPTTARSGTAIALTHGEHRKIAMLGRKGDER